MTLRDKSCCPRCGVPGTEPHDDIIECADAQIEYYAQDPAVREAIERALFEAPPEVAATVTLPDTSDC